MINEFHVNMIKCILHRVLRYAIIYTLSGLFYFADARIERRVLKPTTKPLNSLSKMSSSETELYLQRICKYPHEISSKLKLSF